MALNKFVVGFIRGLNFFGDLKLDLHLQKSGALT